MNKKVIILILLFLVIGGIVIFFLIKKPKSLMKIGKITESMAKPGTIEIGKTYKGGGMF